MASTIGKVRAVFTASTSGLTAGVNQASASMKRLQGDVRSLRGNMAALTAIQGAQLFGSITAGVSQAVTSLVRMGQASADVIDKTSKMAARLGMTYGEMAGLALAGDLAGVSMESIAGAATKADVAFVRAANGSKAAQDAFAAIGLSVEQLNGLSASERFDAIAASIAALPTEAQRAAAAVGIFGRAGAELLPLFAQGAEGIAAARAEAERFGLTLTNMQGQNVEAMNDAFTRAQAAIQGVIQQVVAYLAPAIEMVTTAFSDLIGNVGGATIGQTIGEGILQGARFFAQVADQFLSAASPLWQYVSEVGSQWAAVFEVGRRLFSLVAGVVRLFESAFKFVGSVLVGTLGRVLNAVGELAQFVPGMGEFGRSTEKAGESLMRTSQTLYSEAGAAFEAAGQNFYEAAFGGQQPEAAGEAIAGPVTSALDAAIARSRDAASQIDTANRTSVSATAQSAGQAAQAAAQAAGGAVADGVKEAIQGVDSRSSEGVKEMFRVMRGGDNVQQQQLGVLQEIADNTADMGVDLEVADLAPAAGA